MRTEKSTPEKIISNYFQSKLPLFYKKNSTIINLIADLIFHGTEKFKKINKFSISIEIHNLINKDIRDFNKKQINSAKICL